MSDLSFWLPARQWAPHWKSRATREHVLCKKKMFVSHSFFDYTIHLISLLWLPKSNSWSCTQGTQRHTFWTKINNLAAFRRKVRHFVVLSSFYWQSYPTECFPQNHFRKPFVFHVLFVLSQGPYFFDWGDIMINCSMPRTKKSVIIKYTCHRGVGWLW